MIETITTKDKFKSLETEWHDLFHQASNVTFFQTFKYNWIAWETFSSPSDKLFIIVYRNGKKELQAIFPFFLDRKGHLRFINDKHTDFCNAIISNTVIAIYSLMYDVWKFIEDNKFVKLLFLDNVVTKSPILSYWKVFACNAFVFSQTEHSWIKCFQSDNIFIEFPHLNAKERKRLVSIDRKSSHCSLKISRMVNEPYPEKEVNTLIKEMLNTGLRSSSYLNDRMKLFMRKLYENNLIEIPILYENKEPISLSFTFINESETCSMRWIILYKSGQFNLWNNVRYIIEKSHIGDSVIDFGRGGYDYKMHNFRPNVENLYRFIASKNIRGNWYILFRITVSHIRKTIKKYKIR